VTNWVWEAHRALPNQEVHSVFVPVEEGWNANDHLKDEDAESPPIDGEVVAVSNQHFGCQVLGRAAE